jgi:VIT1/CCC1 family predicted Fe2+/Mn2+ transporter
VGLALLTLFGLGLFLGYISRGNLILYGVKTVVAGAIAILISFLLGG